MSTIGLNELGYDERLYMLAFDHRGSFEKMVGDVERVPGAKTLIWEGFRRAIEEGAPKGLAGVLVDAKYGPTVAREAKAGGYKLAMPVEKSGQNEFDFEYGDQFGRRPGDERAPDREVAAPVGVAARASPQVPLRAARSGGAGTARAGRRQ
jgi:hypothetical protein